MGSITFANAAVAIPSYEVVAGEIRRMELNPQPCLAGKR
jgi:hypothetical protein